MGHERVGILPKSARWTRLVHQMGGVFASEVPVGTLAAQTLQNVRKRYETLFQDDAVKSTFAFLVKFVHACRSQDPHEDLKVSGISMAEKATIIPPEAEAIMALYDAASGVDAGWRDFIRR